MKIRNGFVSNSSSSSYVITVKHQEACIHCGHKPSSIIDLIAKEANQDYDDTLVIAQGKAALLEIFEDGLNSYTHWYKNNPGHKDAANYDERCQDLRELIAEIVALPDDEVAYVDIDYHNYILNTILHDAVAAGTVKILKDFS